MKQLFTNLRKKLTRKSKQEDVFKLNKNNVNEFKDKFKDSITHVKKSDNISKEEKKEAIKLNRKQRRLRMEYGKNKAILGVFKYPKDKNNKTYLSKRYLWN